MQKLTDRISRKPYSKSINLPYLVVWLMSRCSFVVAHFFRRGALRGALYPGALQFDRYFSAHEQVQFQRSKSTWCCTFWGKPAECNIARYLLFCTLPKVDLDVLLIFSCDNKPLKSSPFFACLVFRCCLNRFQFLRSRSSLSPSAGTGLCKKF